jgi:hypothetical protein
MLKPIFTWDPNRQSAIDELRKNISEVTGIVIIGPVEGSISMIPVDQQQQLQDISFFQKIPIYIIVAGHENNPNVISQNMKWRYTTVIRWPLYWLTETLVRLAWPNNDQYNLENSYNIFSNTPIVPDEYKYTFICLNKRPKDHRYMLMDKLSKFNLLKNNAVAYREYHTAPIYKLKDWTETLLFLDQENEHFIQEKIPKEYYYSFMQVVSETDDDLFFLTEKTATPIFLYKPFLVASNQYFHKTLKEFGFELYDELFDYSFDSIANTENRFEALLSNVVKYNSCSKKDLNKYYDLIRDKLIYNRNLAMKIACDTSQFPEQWNYFAKEKSTEFPLSPHDINHTVEEIYKKFLGNI